VIKVCNVCGKTYTTYYKGSNYCSKKCQGKSMIKLYEINCRTCGKLFKPTDSQQQYCSRGCRPQVQKNQVQRSCIVCGKVFYTVPARIKEHRGKYCSKECFSHRRTVTNCKHCGNEIEVYLSDLKTNNFCNKNCKNEWMSYTYNGENSPSWRGGCYEYRGDNWKSQKRAALKRDGYKCVQCGASRDKSKLMIHHKIPFRFFTNYKKANSLNNLITLCNSCHSKQESHLWHEVPQELRYLIEDNTEASLSGNG